MLVYLMMYDSGYVFLEHLLLSWYPPNTGLLVFFSGFEWWHQDCCEVVLRGDCGKAVLRGDCGEAVLRGSA